MFIYRVKVEDLETARMLALESDLRCRENTLRAQCPIREISLVHERRDSELDIYLALDDCIGRAQLKHLVDEIAALFGAKEHVSSELIHI